VTLYDPRRPEVLADPYPVLRGLREEDAPKWLDSLVFRGMRSLPVALG
jgi:hypothetical protein